jgi:hypothetical protein
MDSFFGHFVVTRGQSVAFSGHRVTIRGHCVYSVGLIVSGAGIISQTQADGVGGHFVCCTGQVVLPTGHWVLRPGNAVTNGTAGMTILGRTSTVRISAGSATVSSAEYITTR